MGRFLTVEDFTAQFGEDEVVQIAGNGDWNSLEGAQVDPQRIEAEIAFTDELVGGYVLTRHPWLTDQAVADVPNLIKGLAGDITRYRLRDKQGSQGQITETVEKRYHEAIKCLQAIQAGKLDLVRDRQDGQDMEDTQLPNTGDDMVHISGPPPQADRILEGY